MTATDDESDRNFVTALARGLDVLRCFRPHEQSLSNTDIAQRTGLPKPTVTRLTYTLCQLGYLVHSDSTGFYRLGAGVLQLGYGVLAGVDLADRARAVMRDLAQGGPNLNVNVALGERHRLTMVYTAVQRTTQNIALSMTVGARLPLFRSAIGRAALVAMSEADHDRLLRDAAEEGREDMPAIRAGLKAACAEYAAQGFVTSFGAWRDQINGIAVPIWSLNGDRLYAMNIGAPTFLASETELRDVYGPKLVAAARGLSDFPKKADR